MADKEAHSLQLWFRVVAEADGLRHRGQVNSHLSPKWVRVSRSLSFSPAILHWAADVSVSKSGVFPSLRERKHVMCQTGNDNNNKQKPPGWREMVKQAGNVG